MLESRILSLNPFGLCGPYNDAVTDPCSMASPCTGDRQENEDTTHLSHASASSNLSMSFMSLNTDGDIRM